MLGGLRQGSSPLGPQASQQLWRLTWFSLRVQAAKVEGGRIQAGLAGQRTTLLGGQACLGMRGPRTEQGPDPNAGSSLGENVCDSVSP